MLVRLGQILTMTAVLPLATVGFASGRNVCIHVHGDHASHLHLVQPRALDGQPDAGDHCHPHLQGCHGDDEIENDLAKAPARGGECRGTILSLNDTVTIPLAKRTTVSRPGRTVGSVPVATVARKDITAAAPCRSNRMVQCEPKSYPAIAAILRGNHALLF